MRNACANGTLKKLEIVTKKMCFSIFPIRPNQNTVILFCYKHCFSGYSIQVIFSMVMILGGGLVKFSFT